MVGDELGLIFSVVLAFFAGGPVIPPSFLQEEGGDKEKGVLRTVYLRRRQDGRTHAMTRTAPDKTDVNTFVNLRVQEIDRGGLRGYVSQGRP